ncbi:HvfC/BufC N-terminal domain-containing protein [Iodobacter fluviatilis]|uniref:DNA-binding protein n=1 Tax=Iodobacter fluviatilis TaxID=537 RepID=A0A377Q719_9NEIS|nr:DNA-binding domain-containing protein [Iodobacter fluviatilis]TCU90604.1 putative DNA-binding protein [Iodobacter fluviatilis]STQ89631.1 Uncharacterized protein conserved in bacteria [Iodobacter fluviatilis]
MSLHTWQRDLQASILTASDQIRQPLNQGSISREREIAVYADGYFLRLAEALQSNYPALFQILGDDDFYSLARAYLAAHPSSQPSIRWFGDQLATFLAQALPYASVPIFAELAAFEWALRHTVDAADAPLLTLEDLQAIPTGDWGQLCFKLHPSLSILSLQWNAPKVWQALMAEDAPPEPQRLPQPCLVWRKPDLTLHWRSAKPPEVHALNLLASGANFSSVCEALMSEDINDVPLRAAGFLRTWIEQGLITAA